MCIRDRISWATSDDAVITAEGVITRNEAEGAAVLTATFTLGNVTMTKDINVTVAAVNDEMCIRDRFNAPSGIVRPLVSAFNDLYSEL